jgi:hypothetical protein
VRRSRGRPRAKQEQAKEKKRDDPPGAGFRDMMAGNMPPKGRLRVISGCHPWVLPSYLPPRHSRSLEPSHRGVNKREKALNERRRDTTKTSFHSAVRPVCYQVSHGRCRALFP